MLYNFNGSNHHGQSLGVSIDNLLSYLRTKRFFFKCDSGNLNIFLQWQFNEILFCRANEIIMVA
jgi:hypothetical protein